MARPNLERSVKFGTTGEAPDPGPRSGPLGAQPASCVATPRGRGSSATSSAARGGRPLAPAGIPAGTRARGHECRAIASPRASSTATRPVDTLPLEHADASAGSPPPHPRLAFLLLGAMQFALIAAISVVVAALPSVQADFAVGRGDLALVTAGYGLAFAGLLLLGGRLADWLGPRRVFVWGVLLFGAASAAAAFAPAFALLLLARFAQGCGAALAAPAALALVPVVYPDPARRARALAVWGGLSGGGAAAGLLLSGVIVTWLSWRWAFGLPALAAAVVGLAAPRLLSRGMRASGGSVSRDLDIPEDARGDPSNEGGPGSDRSGESCGRRSSSGAIPKAPGAGDRPRRAERASSEVTADLDTSPEPCCVASAGRSSADLDTSHQPRRPARECAGAADEAHRPAQARGSIPTDPGIAARARGGLAGERGGIDVAGGILAASGLTALSCGLVATETRGWLTAAVLIPLLAAAVLLSAFVRVESRVPAPLLPLSFLASRRRAVALLATVLSSGGMASSAFFLALYLQQVRGFSPLHTSAAFLPYALIPLIGPVAARLVPRLGPAGVTGLGLGVAGVGLALLARLTPTTAYAPLVLMALVIYAIGVGHAFSGATVAALEDAPAHQAGLAGGVLNTAMELGPTVGLALLLSLAALRTARLSAEAHDAATAVTGGYAFALGAAAIAYVVVAALCVFALRRSGPRTTG